MSLKVYQRKRKFNETPEPKGQVQKTGKGPLRFVVQMHEATRLHFDLRLEFEGVFKSWAVPKGPSLNPLDQRLAVFVEDHPLEYGTFEGIIPKGNYGAGTVMLWDEGTYVERGSEGRKDSELAMRKGFDKGHMTFVLSGKKLRGEFALIKLKKSDDQKAWLLVKKRDQFSTYKRSEIPDNLSVKTGRSIEEIASEAEAKGDIWLSKRKSAAAKKNVVKAAVMSESTPKSAPKPTPKSAPKSKVSTLKSEARPGRMPRKIKPMIPISSRKAVEGDWIYEAALDGVRAVAEVEGKRVHLYSKSGLPFDKKYPEVAEDLKKLSFTALLDGEVVKGKNSYFSIFDVLYFDGKDLRGLPLSERKKILGEISVNGKHLKVAEWSHSAKDISSEMIVAKKSDSLYHSGTSAEWVVIESAVLKVSETSEPADDRRDQPRLTNLGKIFFPEDGYTKGDVINYYREISKFILPYLKDRPESLNRHPNGIHEAGFYQKDMTGYIPRWLKTERIFSESSDKSIDYVLCQDERSLLYIANLGCIELNPWFSRVGHLENPDFLVIDLDPDDNDFNEVIEIAHEVREVLESVGVKSFCKTSGATGIHIGVPTAAKYDFDQVRVFAEIVCRIVSQKYPRTTSVERNPSRRRGKIYLDFMQNRRGQTLAAPFCIRPKIGAPVSMPLSWKDLRPGLSPEQYNIKNVPRLISKHNAFWEPVLGRGIDLQKCVKNIKAKFKI